MRPRMYGSSDSQWIRVSTCPSATAGTSVSTIRKFDSSARPWGRLARTICLFFMCVSFSEGEVQQVGPGLREGARQRATEAGDVLDACGRDSQATRQRDEVHVGRREAGERARPRAR